MIELRNRFIQDVDLNEDTSLTFLCLAFGNSIQSTSEFVELWNYGVF